MGRISLRDYQLKAEAKFSVENTRKTLNKLVDYFYSIDEHREDAEFLVTDIRKLDISVARENKMFFLPEEFLMTDVPEEFQHESLGFIKKRRVIYAGRLVIPIRDVKGDVMGFVGWDKYEIPKYLDSKNHGYTAKATTVFGMEKMEEYYKSKDIVFFVEGPMCCLYLRSKGYKALALLGSGVNMYVQKIIARFGSRAIVIPDDDDAGNTLKSIIHRKCPQARVMQNVLAKDIDDSRQENEELLLSALDKLLVNTLCVDNKVFRLVA